MSTKDTTYKTSPATSMLAFLNATTELVPLSSDPSVEKPDSLPIIIALICIFLLLATCLIFVTLCKPVALHQSFYGPHECMPYHSEDASEPQLRLWKRLGSLRHSIRSVKRCRPISQAHETCSRKTPVSLDWSIMESTKM
ncbi:uncharacterized protein C10orf105 homolog [Hemicordylus capensis]|uniref:uncharacterized protein C10orf105 homolog n=1 Tax=Hemicordylus capensis TaxID=884348 RepID=UPI002302E0CF|nr:uncharacterized protein C10orf105 homolog [Hemicordylus capensis]XP_053168543.1 uncharacterized protein C10orf105 homolog [Hemicordylus capensis]XP_053168545.1 uncharacterized protein C10orf105 homolog [Hemicordylus capensis]XP_053168546.1 uncharacterized protein C10orf105 homolog [Hemicordylus capensis]